MNETIYIVMESNGDDGPTVPIAAYRDKQKALEHVSTYDVYGAYVEQLELS